jgi:hypothetical protein
MWTHDKATPLLRTVDIPFFEASMHAVNTQHTPVGQPLNTGSRDQALLSYRVCTYTVILEIFGVK